jgi:hypothetical protein
MAEAQEQSLGEEGKKSCCIFMSGGLGKAWHRKGPNDEEKRSSKESDGWWGGVRFVLLPAQRLPGSADTKGAFACAPSLLCRVGDAGKMESEGSYLRQNSDL